MTIQKLIMAATIVAAVILGTSCFAQAIHSKFYVEDGNGHFSLISGPSTSTTFTLPIGGGTLMTATNAATFNTTSGTTITFPSTSGTLMTNPMSALGDMIYESGGATPAPTRLIGNTSTTKNFLVQTGAGGGVSAVPAWGTIAPADYAVFGASGTNHAQGAVPDPGSTPGTTRYLREDGNWQTPSGGSTAGASFVGSPQVLGQNSISTTATCLGVGGAFTPTKTGKVLVIISGTLGQNGTNQTATLTPFAGTGTDPGYGTSFTASVSGAQIIYPDQPSVGNVTFEASSVITGLTVGNTYYVDVSLKSSNSGAQVTPNYMQMTAIEF